ncbi:hypothetical protein LP420_39930 [Massilia sp. B-10]|nr:hypothetical protein LP420_39930 [Massilia sp. B-10]
MVSSAWTGSVWRAVEQNSGASGYFISGALVAGSTTTAPNVWTLDFLAAALSAPNSEPYNSDPLSGASVQKIGADDGQVGTAGKDLPRPMSVAVFDKDGLPVLGARAVCARAW